MAKIKSSLAKALTLYLVLLPLFGMRAEAQRAPQPSAGSTRPVPQPTPAPAPTPTPTDPSEIVFSSLVEPLTVRAFNDFAADSTAGYFSHHGHAHPGGRVEVSSPWGEQLEIRYWLTPHGFAFEYDEDLLVSYNFDETGTLAEIVAETPEREARMAVGNRAQLAYLGQRDFRSFDLSAYQLVDESLRAKHSEAFLDGIRQFEAASPASCATSVIQCAACIVVWALSLGAIATACTAGSTVTFGAACIAAILAHEASSFSCAATCVEMVEECRGGIPQDPIPDGCEPRD